MGSHVDKVDTSLLPIADEEHEHDNHHVLEDQHGSSQGLKRTCEECTRSKVRCSGPSKGICDRCALRKTECVFRNKLKRGPQTAATAKLTFQKKPKEQQAKVLKQAKAAAPLAEKNVDKLGMSATVDYPPIQSTAASSSTPSGKMTWHERRCWNVFFSTFKHQNRRENPISWCWFALQLDKLRRDLERRQNTAALERLEAWMLKLHTKSSALTLQTSQSCMFAPHLCAGCASAALLAKKGPEAQVKPADTSGESSYIFSPGEKPFIEFEMDSDGARINQINDRFTATFGHTRESLGAALKWSDGGGFLPWGGDLVARLLWSEADVLIYLQVLAVKFQALGPPRHDHEDPYHVLTRDVLSAYIFDVRASNGKNDDFDEMVVPCMVKSLHRETLVGRKLKITVMLEFEPMGPMKPGPETPETLKEAMEAARLRRSELDSSLDSVKETSLDGLSKPPASTRQDSLSSFLPSPREDLALLDPSWDWQTFESSVEEGKSPAPVQRSSSYGSSNRGLQTFEDGMLVPTVRDEDWLASLLEWTE